MSHRLAQLVRATRRLVALAFTPESPLFNLRNRCILAATAMKGWALVPIVAALGLVMLHTMPAGASPLDIGKTASGTWTNASSGAAFGKVGLLGAFVVGATQQSPPKIPFRFGTVRRRLNIGSFPVTMGQALQPIVLPQVGMLSRILVTVTGTYTGANANLVIAQLDGYDALINRAQLILNNGSATVVDLSGIGINQVNLNASPSGALPVKSGLLLTQTAQAFTYKFILPVNANNRRQFEMGLINLQAPEIRASLNVSFNPLANVFTVPANATNFTANANFAYEYFSIPDPTRYQMPALSLVRTLEEAPALIAATGQQIYQIPRLGTMFTYAAVVMQGNKYATAASSITELALRYNKSDVQYDMLINEEQTYESEIWGDHPGAVCNPNAVTLSLWEASDRSTNGGDFRDCIDTEENTTTEMLVTIAGGFSLATPTNALFHVRRVVQRIVQAQGPVA